MAEGKCLSGGAPGHRAARAVGPGPGHPAGEPAGARQPEPRAEPGAAACSDLRHRRPGDVAGARSRPILEALTPAAELGGSATVRLRVGLGGNRTFRARSKLEIAKHATPRRQVAEELIAGETLHAL